MGTTVKIAKIAWWQVPAFIFLLSVIALAAEIFDIVGWQHFANSDDISLSESTVLSIGFYVIVFAVSSVLMVIGAFIGSREAEERLRYPQFQKPESYALRNMTRAQCITWVVAVVGSFVPGVNLVVILVASILISLMTIAIAAVLLKINYTQKVPASSLPVLSYMPYRGAASAQSYDASKFAQQTPMNTGDNESVQVNPTQQIPQPQPPLNVPTYGQAPVSEATRLSNPPASSDSTYSASPQQ
ncbi:hypothetical protein ACFQY8_04895 [Alloscardovia venturai]|uniref:Uncharacterized protein n=1 Tax=Alloscardovia venturai TaxID=1769421 RepID=A0ABW2Y764_9BIFI